MAEVPVLVEAVGDNMTPYIDGGRVKKVEPRPEDTPDGVSLIPRSPRGPDFSPPHETISDCVGSAPGSFDVMDLGAGELGLSGGARAPLLPASWRKLAGGVQS
jgi:hypothetical protein